MQEVIELCGIYDIIFLQETWLLDSEIPYLSSIHNDFYGAGISAMISTEKLHTGRPYGGLGVIWRKNLGLTAKLDTYDDTRLLGITFDCDDNRVLILSVYLPCDVPENTDLYQMYLAKIEDIVDSHPTPYVMVIGDFNANICSKRETRKCAKLLINFCDEQSLIMSDKVLLKADTFTFYSEAHKSTSWIDHVVCTRSMHEIILDIKVLRDYVTSDHIPIVVKIGISNMSRLNVGVKKPPSYSVRWSNLSSSEKNRYSDLTFHLLSGIIPDSNLMSCVKEDCTSKDHRLGIDKLYHGIITALQAAHRQFATLTKHGGKTVPGWNEYCREAHDQAREAFVLWQNNSKPRQGALFQLMQTTRARFKSALRYCRANESRARADALARRFLLKDTKSFWGQIKHLKNDSNFTPASTVDGITGEEHICSMWRDHYSTLLNSNSDTSSKQSVLHSLSTSSSNNLRHNFTTEEIDQAIRTLKKDRAAGPDILQAEHFIFAHPIISEKLAQCFNAMLLHAYIPSDFMLSHIIPIVKDKRGLLTDKDNYRPIAIVTISSKIFEKLLLRLASNELQTYDNQFSFKVKHGTDMCIFALKQTVEFYMSQSSPVYACFIDSSKAFDRINHWTLFKKLLSRNVNLYFVKILVYWYTSQTFSVKWGSLLSSSFTACNGLRQGGVLSPALFNVYMDDLSKVLIESKLGCMINGVMLNHFMYADDCIVCAPSPQGLQKILDICSKYAENNTIVYNKKKSECIVFCPKSKVDLYIPSFTLNGAVLNIVNCHKYLGVMLKNDLSDDADIQRQVKSVYAQGNTLIRKFKACSVEIKHVMFRTYMSCMYGCPLWAVYRDSTFDKLKVALNNVYRNMFNVEFGTSMTTLFVSHRLLTMPMLQRRDIFSLRFRVANSENTVLHCIFNSIFFFQSKLQERWYRCLF